ncbi:MAG: serine hydrolase domain-containing protein [Chloroflexota bacterium]
MRMGPLGDDPCNMQPISRPDSPYSAADQTLAQAVAAGDIPGVVALAADRQRVLYQGAFGLRDLASPRPMTLDTVFSIASMTKAVTAVAALQLVERGLLTLDQPAGDRLPELAAAQVLDGFDVEGVPLFRKPFRAITLRHLLTHTAGFAYPTWNASLDRLEQHTGMPVLFDGPLVFDPGERWEYGTNIDWVGRLIEVIAGQSLENYFREYIFDPLGMTDTSYILHDETRARLAVRHQRQADGTLERVDVQFPNRPARFAGGGGLFSTGPDYLVFLRTLLAGGRQGGVQILQPEQVAELGRNHIADLNVGILPAIRPNLTNEVNFFPGTIKKWGLGGLINTRRTPAGRSAGSWAWGGLFNTYFWLDSTAGVTGLILTQILPFCDGSVLRLFDAFETDIYSSL